MASKRARRAERIPCTAAASISWTDADCHARFARGRCLDFSHAGLRIEVPTVVPVNSYVTLRIHAIGAIGGADIDVAGSARVRHARLRGAKAVLGLELSQALHGSALEAFRALAAPTVSAS